MLTSVQMLRDIKHNSGILFLPTLAFGEDLAFCIRAKEAGYELSEEQLNSMAGGWCLDCDQDCYDVDFKE